MQACPSCGHMNADNAAFCSQCGTRLLARSMPRGATQFLQPEVIREEHRLVLMRPGGTDGAVHTLPSGKTRIGRGGVQVRLDDPYVSPTHAEVTVSEGRLAVQDLQSSNGVYLRIRGEAQLAPGDEFRIGRQLLRLDPLPPPELAPDSGRIWGSPSREARLRIAQLLEGASMGEAMPVSTGEYLFGREEGWMTFPTDPSVSRRHAVLAVSRAGVSLRDLESANGTFLRLRREVALTPGDQLLIGTQQLRYDVGS